MVITGLLLAIATVFTLAALYFIIRNEKDTEELSSHHENLQQNNNHDERTHIIVHELRAPVVAIKDTAGLLVSGKLSEEDQKKMLNLIHEQANKMLAKISTILDSAKVEDGELVLKKSLGDLGGIVKDEMSLFMAEAKRKNIKLIAEISNDLPTFPFDNIRITEAINNILSNSLKYTNENGEIKITVYADETYQKTKRVGNVMVSIADNGIGIAEDKQHMLFTKFADLNNNSNKENDNLSSGLGLYITKAIIEAHGGNIIINSKVGKGTTATFCLPIDTRDLVAEPMRSYHSSDQTVHSVN